MKLNSFTTAVTRSWLPQRFVRAMYTLFQDIWAADKRMMIMKINLTLFIVFLAFMQVTAETFAQKITLDKRNVSLEKVFELIEKQTDYVFVYNSYDLKNTKIDIHAVNSSIEELMEDCLKSVPFTFTIVKNNILVKKNEAKESSKLPFMVVPQRDLKGRVTDESGETLPGVSVLVKGTSTGTITDLQGQFSLSIPDAGATLVFSYIGFVTKEISVGRQNELNVVLTVDQAKLNEVVVIGYGTQKKRDISSAISSVTAEELKDIPVANFAQAITGKMAGVRILNSNNAPGGGSNIVIRGISSINASNYPLVVIDGFPSQDGFNQTENPLNAINTADIESIEILKDASSSAIYGARAANGVIIVTTKKGKVGKPGISVDVNNGLEMMTNKMEVLKRDDFLKFMDDARAQAYVIEDPNYGTNNPNVPQWKWSDPDATRLYNWKNFSSNAAFMGQGGTYYEHWIYVTPETKAQPYDEDWQDLTTQPGKVQDFQLSTRGGTENMKYMLSGGYFNQDGIVKPTGYNRFSFRANVELKINNWMKTGLLLAPSLENSDIMYNMESAFYDIVSIPPIIRARDDNGDPNFIGYIAGDYREWNLNNYSNPLVYDMVKDRRQNVKSLSTIFGEINLIKNLVLRSEFHTEYRNWERNYFMPASFPDAWSTTRSSGLNNVSSRLFWNSQNFLTYNRTLGKHSINSILGYSIEESLNKGTFIQKYDYPTDKVPTLNQAITILNAQSQATTSRSSEAMIGSFARAMYNYAGRYYLTASVRRDGSSKFGANRKWGVFPSVSAAWRISDEGFFSPLKPYFDDLKIRGGWGVIGNSGIGNYNALSTLNTTSYVLGASSTISSGYVDGKVANSNLGWESTTDFSLGVDAELLKNRISLSVDYFHRLTEDMLFSMPLPSITGFGSYLVNIGSMRNRGFEYLLSTRNLVGDFSWSTNFNLSYYRNRVLNTGNDKRPLISNNSYSIEGKPLAGLWGADFLGPYKNWEDVKTNPIVNPTSPIWRDRSSPGTNKLQDVNSDGVINGLDNTILGSPNPDFIWAVTNNFRFKGLDLSVQVNGVSGGERMMTQMESVMSKATGVGNIVKTYYDNYWRPDRTDAKYAAPNRKVWDGTSDRGTLVFKGTYVNFQNIALGYTFPKTLLQKMNLGMNQFRVYATVRNALLLTKYPGFNPEVNQSGSSALSQGIDAGSYPMSRTVSLGVNVSL